jgi:hypothetical protein
VTFVALGESEEKRIIAEIDARLGQATFAFE